MDAHLWRGKHGWWSIAIPTRPRSSSLLLTLSPLPDAPVYYPRHPSVVVLVASGHHLESSEQLSHPTVESSPTIRTRDQATPLRDEQLRNAPRSPTPKPLLTSSTITHRTPLSGYRDTQQVPPPLHTSSEASLGFASTFKQAVTLRSHSEVRQSKHQGISPWCIPPNT